MFASVANFLFGVSADPVEPVELMTSALPQSDWELVDMVNPAAPDEDSLGLVNPANKQARRSSLPFISTNLPEIAGNYSEKLASRDFSKSGEPFDCYYDGKTMNKQLNMHSVDYRHAGSSMVKSKIGSHTDSYTDSTDGKSEFSMGPVGDYINSKLNTRYDNGDENMSNNQDFIATYGDFTAAETQFVELRKPYDVVKGYYTDYCYNMNHSYIELDKNDLVPYGDADDHNFDGDHNFYVNHLPNQNVLDDQHFDHNYSKLRNYEMPYYDSDEHIDPYVHLIAPAPHDYKFTTSSLLGADCPHKRDGDSSVTCGDRNITSMEDSFIKSDYNHDVVTDKLHNICGYRKCNPMDESFVITPSFNKQPLQQIQNQSKNHNLGPNTKTYNHMMEESWLLTPPPCFTASMPGSTDILSVTPLENALIEHPSMSVYHPTKTKTGGKSAKVTKSGKQRKSVMNKTIVESPRRACAVAARAGLVDNLENRVTSQRIAQMENTRHVTKKQCDRANKCGKVTTRGSRSNRNVRPCGSMSKRAC